MTGMDSHGHKVLERVYQVGLELKQHELRVLPAPVLREISLCCFNDLRTIFLVHDKRMLGIVLQELSNLVEVQKVLTAPQADILRQGIAPTMIPGSREMASLSMLSKCNPEVRHNYLVKPIRSGKGAGIVFGSDMTPESWISQLEMLQRPGLLPRGNTYVVQRRIEQPKYDITLNDADGLRKNYLVGTYLSVHAHYVGLGLWRMSRDRICALSTGGQWVCSVVPARKSTSCETAGVKAGAKARL